MHRLLLRDERVAVRDPATVDAPVALVIGAR
jgi:hypothetical protein